MVLEIWGKILEPVFVLQETHQLVKQISLLPTLRRNVVLDNWSVDGSPPFGHPAAIRERQLFGVNR